MIDIPKCFKCGSRGYVPHDAPNKIRCSNGECELHKIENVLSIQGWHDQYIWWSEDKIKALEAQVRILAETIKKNRQLYEMLKADSVPFEMVQEIAHEAHLMGRVYSTGGEVLKPGEQYALIETMIEFKSSQNR